jgi:hypothetical protein
MKRSRQVAYDGRIRYTCSERLNNSTFRLTPVFTGPGYTLVVFLHTPRHRPLVEDKLVQIQQFMVYIHVSDAAFVVTILYLEIRLQIRETPNL